MPFFQINLTGKMKNMNRVIVFIALSFTVCLSAQKKVQKELKTKVFLLAGQSNMDGRAKAQYFSDEDKERLDKAKENVTLYYNHQKPVPLQETKVAQHTAKKFGATHLFGPEVFFGIEMSEKHPNHNLILIKRSRGGMSLYGAWSPDWTLEKAKAMGEEKAPALYNDFIDYAHEVLKTLPKDSYELCGILWVQGESDSGTKKNGTLPADTYEQNLKTLIKGVRAEFSNPKLPFVMFQVGGGKVVEGMKSIAKKDVYVSLIPQSNNKKSADYFERNPPPIGHYTYKSMKRIGTLFFDCFQTDYMSEN